MPPLELRRGRTRRRSGSGRRRRRRRPARPGSGPPASRPRPWRARSTGRRAAPARRRPGRRAAPCGGWTERCLHRLQEADPADRAVAALCRARAARAAVDPVALQQHRVAPLQHFRVGQPRVGHVGVHAPRCRRSRARRRCRRRWSRNTGSGVAEGEVVHRPLRGRQHAQGAVERVGHPLRGLDVAGADGGRIRGRRRSSPRAGRCRSASGSPRSSGCPRRPGCGRRRARPRGSPPRAR